MMAYWSVIIRQRNEDGTYQKEQMVCEEGITYFEAVTKIVKKYGQKTWVVKNLGISTHMPEDMPKA